MFLVALVLAVLGALERARALAPEDARREVLIATERSRAEAARFPAALLAEAALPAGRYLTIEEKPKP